MSRMNAAAFAVMVDCLLDGTLTCTQIAEASGLHVHTVYSYCGALHRRRTVHIADWEDDARGRATVKVYKLGRARDAKRPKLTRKQITYRWQARRRKAAKLAAQNNPFAQLVAAA